MSGFSSCLHRFIFNAFSLTVRLLKSEKDFTD